MTVLTRVGLVLAGALVAIACASVDAPSAPVAEEAPSSPPGVGAFGDGGAGAIDPSCAIATYTATKAPLALQVMLDRSDSMLVTTPTGATKWASAANALATFLGTAAASTMSIGLSYFPQRAAGVPATCTTNAQCGARGPCGVRFCLREGEAQACSSSAECNGDPCVPIGKCSIADELCLPNAADPCGPGGGTCRLWCSQETSCTTADYAKPAVAIGQATQTKSDILGSLASTVPYGDTPTAPALAGAIVSAKDFASKHPDFVTSHVLVTDGLPTDCNVTSADEIAQLAGLGLEQGIRTFVVGIFAPDEALEAQANLDRIAAGGGTSKAIVIETSSNVATELAAALEGIRTRAVPCEYALPEPPGGVVDKAKVNVTVTPKGAAASTIPFVEDASRCGTTAGWHYDADAISKIVLCPSTCDAVAKADDVAVEVVTGCQTIVR
jgi:hypothetical protein